MHLHGPRLRTDKRQLIDDDLKHADRLGSGFCGIRPDLHAGEKPAEQHLQPPSEIGDPLGEVRPLGCVHRDLVIGQDMRKHADRGERALQFMCGDRQRRALPVQSCFEVKLGLLALGHVAQDGDSELLAGHCRRCRPDVENAWSSGFTELDLNSLAWR
jgi:hypothetical protein